MNGYLEERRELLGSQIEITLDPTSFTGEASGEGSSDFDESGEVALRAAFDECARIEQAYSRFIEGNELASLNASVGEWTTVSLELAALIRAGAQFHRRTEGAFDLRVKGTLESWGYDAEYSLQEKGEGRNGTNDGKSDPGIQFRDLDPKERLVPPEGQDSSPVQVKLSAPIDLGGLGKGYALDRMREQLQGFRNVLIDAGGDLWAQGVGPDGEPWRVYFEHPTDPTQAIGQVSPDGLSLACSHPNRRRWRDRHHLVDPHSGTPANAMLVVYTQASDGMIADAYATALFVMGYDRARDWLESAARTLESLEAMIISPRGELYRTSGFLGELFTAS